MHGSIDIDGVTVGYTDDGSGPVLVFVHGAYVTGALWSDVVQALSVDHRCIVPTWPFGAHPVPAGDVNLGVRAAGRRIIAFVEDLGLDDVTLVVNDTGGGIILAALGDQDLNFGRVARLVLTNCDSFEHFPPKGFAPIVKLCALSATAGSLLLAVLASKRGLRFFATAVTKNGIAPNRYPEIFGAFATSATVRREAARFSADLNPRHTLGAVPALRRWSKPVLVAWGDSDRLFPLSHARRLADIFPAAALDTITDAATYVMLDQPARTARAIRQFVARGLPPQPG